MTKPEITTGAYKEGDRFRQHDRDKGLVAIRSRHVGLSRRDLGRRNIEPSRSQDLCQILPEQG
ncbi:hypothetical protein Taro_030095 [Colocasia esculenta]|uniref:Uncharacterized protein n=1 Tax=Colocasia esculenta TaxID=4460 RepID=A0A843VV49_COLES|nr:hypothetical protein [Colocasia esculenta]